MTKKSLDIQKCLNRIAVMESFRAEFCPSRFEGIWSGTVEARVYISGDFKGLSEKSDFKTEELSEIAEDLEKAFRTIFDARVKKLHAMIHEISS